MAPVAMILGGISGTFSALFGLVFFGVGFWGAVLVYFCVALGVTSLMIAMALLRSGPDRHRRTTVEPDHAKPATLQRA